MKIVEMFAHGCKLPGLQYDIIKIFRPKSA